MRSLDPRDVDVRPTLRERLPVADPRRGGDDHPGADVVGTPAEVEVFTEELDVGIEATEMGEQVGPDEGARTGDGEHVAHRVVLLLVEVTPLGVGRRPAGLVDRVPDGLQPFGVVPVDQFGSDDPRVGSEGLLDQPVHRGRVEDHVVMAEAQEAGALDQFEHLVQRGSEADVVLESTDERPGQDARDARCGVDVAGRVDHEHREVGVRLADQRLERLVQPRIGVVGHHDDDDRWRFEVDLVEVGSGVVRRARPRPGDVVVELRELGERLLPRGQGQLVVGFGGFRSGLVGIHGGPRLPADRNRSVTQVPRVARAFRGAPLRSRQAEQHPS